MRQRQIRGTPPFEEECIPVLHGVSKSSYVDHVLFEQSNCGNKAYCAPRQGKSLPAE